MTVRAKFQCTKKEKYQEAGYELGFQAVIDSDDPEDHSFFQYTPWGEINIGTISEVAAQQFEVGKSYYIDFSPADSNE